MPSATHSRQPEFTPQAEYDLEQVEEFISQDNPQAARRIIERIRDLSFTLAEQPHMGISRPNFGPDHRSFVVSGTHYIIIYRPTDTGVEIVHVHHGSQDLTDLFKQ